LRYKWQFGIENSLEISKNIVLPQFEIRKTQLRENIIELSSGKNRIYYLKFILGLVI
jgi:hypothetical protein